MDGEEHNEPSDPTEATEHTSTRHRVVSQVRSDRIALTGGVIVLVMLGLTIFSIVDEFLFNRTIISTVLHDPYALNSDGRLQGPTLTHPM